MCQPKSKGGKRCLKHAKLSQFMVRLVGIKTGADESLVSQTLSELNREGKARNLAPVSAQEVAGLIQKQELGLDVDNRVDSHNRKILHNQLQAAKDETKRGVDGSHFYAWKNLLTRVRSKLRTAVLSLGIVGSLAIGISGCSAGIGPSQPTNSPAPSISITQTVPATNDGDLGAVVPSGTTVTDSEGKYETTKLPADSNLYDYNKKIVSDSAESTYSQKDILAAQKFVVDFVTTEGVDSVAVDRDEQGWQDWQDKTAAKYIAADYVKDLLNTKPDNGDRATIIVNDLNNQVPTLVRDGGSRIANEKVTLSTISAGRDASVGNYITVEGKATVNYRLTKESAIKQLQINNPGVTRADLQKAYPKLFDANAANPVLNDVFDFSYSLIKEKGAWKIAGYGNNVTGNIVAK